MLGILAIVICLVGAIITSAAVHKYMQEESEKYVNIGKSGFLSGNALICYYLYCRRKNLPLSKVFWVSVCFHLGLIACFVVLFMTSP